MAEITQEDLLEVLQQALALNGHHGDSGIPKGSVLTGYAVIVEWMTPAGELQLTRYYPFEMPEWRRHGLFLYGADEHWWEDEDG